MEGNDVLSTLAVMDGYRKNDNHCCYDYGHKGGNRSTTAIGLAAGLGGGALLLGIAGLWGINQASKARNEGAMNQLNALTNYSFMVHNNNAAWQLQHAPTISQMVDVRTGAQASSSASALANAESALLTNALLGKTQCCPDEVTLVSKQYCPCPASNPCGCGCN